MLILLVLIVGLVFGSFVAAYTYRYPRGISIAEGTSFCDKCGRKIMWYENIPVVSYLLLKGRCKKCRKKISPRYPVIEILTSIGFLIIYSYFKGSPLQGVYSIIIFLILELILIIDFENQIIPDDFVFVGIALVFLYRLLLQEANLFPYFISSLLASLFLLLIFIFTYGRGMGLGDVKFALFGGMIVGLNNLFVWLFLSFFIGAVMGIVLIISRNAKFKDKIAFGPFLIISIPLTLTHGSKILELINLR